MTLLLICSLQHKFIRALKRVSKDILVSHWLQKVVIQRRHFWSFCMINWLLNVCFCYFEETCLIFVGFFFLTDIHQLVIWRLFNLSTCFFVCMFLFLMYKLNFIVQPCENCLVPYHRRDPNWVLWCDVCHMMSYVLWHFAACFVAAPQVFYGSYWGRAG